MNSYALTHSILFAGLRIAGILLALAGLLNALILLAEGWFLFDPNYIGHFLFSMLLRPFLLVLAGTILYLAAGRIATIATKPMLDQEK